MHEMFCSWVEYQIDCQENTINKPPLDNNTYWQAEYDGFACWPYGVPGEVTEIPCPNYLKYLNESAHTFRHCTSSGTWLMSDCKDEPWQNIDACVPAQSEEIVEEQDDDDQYVRWNKLISVLDQVYPVGYVVSISCLTITLSIFVYFKKLHCTRNYIHMNLMLSFILRYTSILVKDKVFIDHYDFSQVKEAFRGSYENLLGNQDVLRTYCQGGNTMACRIAIVLMHYAVLANFSWLLAEGVYLQLVISRNFTGIKRFPLFLALGWGLPVVPMIIWVISRLKTANENCWEDAAGGYSWVAINVPILLTILINFLIFIDAIRILIFKLRAHSITQTDSKYRSARSTLTLILLVGIPCIVFGFFPFLNDQESEQFKVAYMICVSCKVTFTSIQGALVAILYCFFNSEVQGEVKKFIRTWRKRTLNQELSGSYSEQMTSSTPLNTKDEVQEMDSLDNNKPHCEMLA